MTPTELTLKHMRKLGFYCVVVEKWNPFVPTKDPKHVCPFCKKPEGFGIRQDLFGFADIYAINPRTQDRVFIQTTTKHNMVARKLKILGNNNLPTVLNSGHRVVVHGWMQTGDHKWGQYDLTEMEITL